MQYYMTNDEFKRFYKIALSSENVNDVEDKMEKAGYSTVFLNELVYYMAFYNTGKQDAFSALQFDIGFNFNHFRS